MTGRPATRRLIRRVVVALVVTVGGGMLASTMLSGAHARRTLQRLGGEEANSFGEILAYEITRNYELDDERGLSGFIQGVVRRRPEVLHLAVVGASSRAVIASTSDAEVGKKRDDEAIRAALRGEPPPPAYLGEDDSIVSVLVPLRVGRGKEAPRGVLILEQSQARLVAVFSASRRLEVTLAIFTAMLIAGGLGWYLDRRLVRPIKALAESARSIAARDLTRPLPRLDTGDELSDLVAAVGMVAETTRTLVARLGAATGAIASATRTMEEAARAVRTGAASQRAMAESSVVRLREHREVLEELGAGAREAVARADSGGRTAQAIAVSGNELVDVAMRAAGDVKVSVEAIAEVAGALRQILEAAEGVRRANAGSATQAQLVHHSNAGVRLDAAEAARVADALGEEAGRGEGAVDRVVARIHEIDERVRRMAGHIESLNPALVRIVGIANTVGEIADQTRVLSLNASILAARAGDAGSGFRVVADRVRELSALTRDSAQEIAELAGSVEKSAPVVFEEVQTTRASVADAVALGEDAGAALSRILHGSQSLREATARIAAAAEVQVSASQRLLDSTAAVLPSVDQLVHAADRHGEATSRLASRGQALSDAAEAVGTRARRQEELARSIENGARDDAARLRALGGAAQGGVEGSVAIAQSTSEIVTLSAGHAATVARFEEMVTALSAETAALGAEIGTFQLPVPEHPSSRPRARS